MLPLLHYLLYLENEEEKDTENGTESEDEEEYVPVKNIPSNEKTIAKMKLVEPAINVERENTCNGNGIVEKSHKTMATSEPSNGDLNDSGSNESALGVGDLLVENTHQRSNDSEENCFQNGSKADDSTSVSSSSSNFRITEQDLSEEEMTLIDEEEEEGLPIIAETENNYFSSSPIPKPDEDKNEESASAVKKTTEATNSEKTKDINTSSEEKSCNRQSESEDISEKSNDKNSSSEKSDKSDDNLENLISDLNEQSTSAIKSENKKVTISELRQEIEDFIRNHDKDDSQTESTDTENSETHSSATEDSEPQTSGTENSKSQNSEIENNKPISPKNENSSDNTELQNENDIKMETESEIKTNEIEIEEHELKMEDHEIKLEDIENKIDDLESHQINIESSTFASTKIKEENVETVNNTAETNSEMTEKISEVSEKSNIGHVETKSSSIENKHCESMDTDETNATENNEADELETNESDISTCQKIVDDSEKFETENSNEIESMETENKKSDVTETEKNQIETEKNEMETENNQIKTGKNEMETENNQKETENNLKEKVDDGKIDNEKIEKKKSEINIANIEDSSLEDKNENNIINKPFHSMEIDITENETEIVLKKPEELTLINNDDVEMKDDFDKIKETPNNKDNEKILDKELKFKINEEISGKETENQTVMNNKEESLRSEDKDHENKSDTKENEDMKENKIEKKEETKKEEIKGYEESDKPEEGRPSLKRNLEVKEDFQDAKKLKINGVTKPDQNKPYVKLDAFRDYMSRKEVSTLTRTELEELCLQKMCEVLTQTSEIGELNRKITQQETMVDTYRTKFNTLNKQIRDLEIVHSKVLQEIRSKAKESNIEVTPVKITRSVGLQVSLQPIAGRVRQVVPQQETVPRKIHRSSLPNNVPSTSSAPQNIMPPPPRPPIHKSPIQGKGIKTILPKVYPPAEPKDPNPPNASLLGSYLQNPGPSKASTSPPIRKSSPASVPSTSAGPSNSTPKVIDLTDEDDVQKTTGGGTSSGNIRVVSPQQLQGTPVTSTVSRVSYVMPQQVLLASTAPRPGGQRSTVMFKPVAPGQVPAGQRLNIVRPNQVPGISVIPSTSSATQIRPQQIRFATTVASPRAAVRTSLVTRHPAPLPGPPAVQPSQPNWKAMPPKPSLKISRVGDGIVLSWKMQNNKDMSLYEDIGSYQLYAYQETSGPPSTDMWRKVGDVKALALPMACTLTQFTDGNKYHFAVRAVDVKSRVGPFSQPEQIALPSF